MLSLESSRSIGYIRLMQTFRNRSVSDGTCGSRELVSFGAGSAIHHLVVIVAIGMLTMPAPVGSEVNGKRGRKATARYLLRQKVIDIHD